MQKILVYVSLVAVAFVGLAPQMSRAEDWPMWRGPRGDGISHDPEVPTRWTSTENIVWKVALPGQGLSSPIVSADAVFVTCVIPETQSRHLLGLERSSGKILWNTLVHTGPIENQHKFNTSASSTPAHWSLHKKARWRMGLRVFA